MDDQNQTLNENVQEDSSSSFQTSGDLISTVERTTPQTPAEEPQKTEGTPEEGNEPQQNEDERFDKHPRFQQLIKERNEYRERLDALERQSRQAPPQQQQQYYEEELPYVDLAQMEDEDILAWQAEDPKGFARNMAMQNYYETRQLVMEEMQQQNYQRDHEAMVARTYGQYAQENPDFEEMWDRGEIQRFIERNPGHNPISAHMALTMDNRIETAQKTAAQKAAEKARMGATQRQQSRTLTGQPVGVRQPQRNDDELKNPMNYGGVDNVLVERVKRRMAQRGT